MALRLFVGLLEKVLRVSPSPVSRSAFSGNYTRFSLLLWLGFAAIQRPHTPSTTPFHYPLMVTDTGAQINGIG